MNCLLIGDMGHGTQQQLDVATSMKQLYSKYKPTFVIGLGDNIYPNGCNSIKDVQFQDKFEIPYHILPNDTWYMCLGNHDYGYDLTLKGFKDNSMNQVRYTDYSEKWYMPSKYYSFTKGPVEFFYLDTNIDRMSKSTIDTQIRIMKQKIDSSKKKFKVVVGHHTWRSLGDHGNAEPKLEVFFNKLFKDTQPHLYLGGHDHCKSLIVKDKTTIVVLGTGGESYNTIHTDMSKLHDCILNFFSSSLGVGLLTINKKQLQVAFFNIDGFCEYKHTINP